MKFGKMSIFFFLLTSLLLTSCTALLEPEDPGLMQTQQEATLQAKFKEAQTSTAVFETSVAKALTEQAPPPTSTFTMTPVPTETPNVTDTPVPTETMSITSTPSPEPTSENPWVLQQWCEDHVGCVKIEVKNKQDNWVQVFLTYLENNQSGFFSIRPRGNERITLRPGRYRYKLVGCGGSEVTEGINPLNSNWYIVFPNMCK